MVRLGIPSEKSLSDSSTNDVQNCMEPMAPSAPGSANTHAKHARRPHHLLIRRLFARVQGVTLIFALIATVGVASPSMAFAQDDIVTPDTTAVEIQNETSPTIEQQDAATTGEAVPEETDNQESEPVDAAQTEPSSKQTIESTESAESGAPQTPAESSTPAEDTSTSADSATSSEPAADNDAQSAQPTQSTTQPTAKSAPAAAPQADSGDDVSTMPEPGCVPDSTEGIGQIEQVKALEDGDFNSDVRIELTGNLRTFRNGDQTPPNFPQSANVYSHAFIATNYGQPANLGDKTFFDLRPTEGNPHPKITGISPDSTLNMNVTANMTNLTKRWENMDDLPRSWIYELPFDADEILEQSWKTRVFNDQNNQPVGIFKIVRGCGANQDTAYARFDIANSYITNTLKGQTSPFIRFAFALDMQPSVDHRIEGDELPLNDGSDVVVDVTWTSRAPESNKTCTQRTTNGTTKNICTIKISSIKEDMRNVRLYDKSTGMTVVPGSIVVYEASDYDIGGNYYLYRDYIGIYDPQKNEWVATQHNRHLFEQITGDFDGGEENGHQYDFMLDFGTLTAFKYTGHVANDVGLAVEYEVELEEGVQWNNETSSYNKPVDNDWWMTYNKDGRRAGHVSVNKNLDVNRQNVVITTSSTNYCNDHQIRYSGGLNSDYRKQRAWLDGFILKVTLSKGQRINLNTLNIQKHNGQTWLDLFKYSNDYNDGDYDKTVHGEFVYDESTNSFTYTFPDGVGYDQISLGFYTDVEMLTVDGKEQPAYIAFTDTMETWWKEDPEHKFSYARSSAEARYLTCVPGGTRTADLTKTNAQQEEVHNKHVIDDMNKPADDSSNWLTVRPYVNPKTQVESSTHLLVPWEINLNIDREKQMHASDPDWGLSSLRMYEDWVSATSDGNTLHMWYSADTLNLRIQMQQKNEDGTMTWVDLVEGSASDPRDYQVYGNLSTKENSPGDYYAKKDTPLPTTGETFPANWRAKNDHPDNYSLHQGVPRYRIEFSRKITGNIRITYTTIFDKTPDYYTNYAKFKIGIDGVEQKAEVNSKYVYNDGFSVGKATDIDNYGKDYWNMTASRGVCPSGSDESEGRECWVVPWTVWANAPKPWGQPQTDFGYDYWAAGISGQQDMSAKPLVFTDTMPRGWKLDRDSLKAYIHQANYDPNSGKVSTTDHVFEVDIPATIEANHMTVTEPNEQQRLQTGNNKFTVTIDNTDNLICKTADGDGTQQCPSMKEKSLIVFTYDSYLPCDYAIDHNLYKAGETQSVSNHADISLGEGEQQIPNSTTGTVTIYKPTTDSDKISKTTTGGITNGLLPYTITVNGSLTQNLFNGRDHVTVTDTLDPRATFDRDSFKTLVLLKPDKVENNPSARGRKLPVVDKDGNPVLDENGEQKTYTLVTGSTYSAYTQEVEAGQVPYTITTDPSTGVQTLRAEIPKTLYKTISSTTRVRIDCDNTVAIRLYYGVKLNGLPGQTLKNVKNGAQVDGTLSGNTTSTLREIRLQNASASVAIGATPTLLKTDSATGAPLQGARFSLKQVDLSSFYTEVDGVNTLDTTSDTFKKAATAFATKLANGEALPYVSNVQWQGPMTDDNGNELLVSGADGKVYLPNLSSYNQSLFVINETEAPEHYTRIERNLYMLMTDYDWQNQQFKQLMDVIDAINDNNALADKPTSRLNPLDGSTGQIGISNDHKKEVSWSKIDGNASTLNDDGTVAESVYLSGSEWRISTAGTSGTCAGEDTANANLLPCTFSVRDADAEVDSTEDGNGTEGTYVTDHDGAGGRIRVEGLQPGVTYTLTETKAPDKYAPGNDTYQFTINDKGEVTWIGNATPYHVVAVQGEGDSETPTPTGEVAIANYLAVRLPNAGGFGRRTMILGLGLVIIWMIMSIGFAGKRNSTSISAVGSHSPL